MSKKNKTQFPIPKHRIADAKVKKKITIISGTEARDEIPVNKLQCGPDQGFIQATL